MLPASIPVELTWNAPTNCPTHDDVAAEIARILSASKAPRVEVTVRADVSLDEQGRWHAALRVRSHDAYSERILDAESCPAIAAATAVIVAVAVEGGVPETAVPAPVPAAKSESTFWAAAPEPRRTSQVAIGAAGAFDAGLLPSFAPGVEGTIGWAYAGSAWRLRAVATGSFFPAQHSARPQGASGAPGEVGTFELFAAAARACGSIVRGAFDVGPCLGAEIDVMTGTGSAPAQPTPGTGTWPSALASVLATWSLSSHFAFMVRGEGFYAPSAPWFGLTSSTNHIDVYRPSRIGGRGAFGFEVRFF